MQAVRLADEDGHINKNHNNGGNNEKTRKNYDQLVFVHLSAKNEELSKIESDFAWITKSEFWRNGRTFKRKKLDQYKDYYSKVCEEMGITKEIQSSIQRKVEEKIEKFYEKSNDKEGSL